MIGGEKAKTGTRILDSSDVMGLLGYPKVPLMLNESHLRDGLTNHPEMTAAAWKKVPGWIENPVAVYTDPRHPGRLTLIAPETLAGHPVVMAIEPNPGSQQRGKSGAVPAESLLVTAYAKTTGGLPAAGMLALSGHMKYVDTKNAPGIWQSAGGQFPRQSALSQGRHKILTEKQLGGYRQANNPAYSQSLRPELADQLLALQPKPATKESVQAAVRQLVGIGLLPNELGRVVVATSSEIKQNWEPIIGKTGMEASGEAGRAQGFYDPKTKTVFLIADHINVGDELGVAAHELMHKHGQAVLGEEGWNTLHSVISGWAKAEAGSMERRVYAEAAARVRQSRPSDADVGEYSSQELFPYAVQVALELGVKPNAFSRPGTVAKWLAQVKLALREVWKKVTGTARGEATFKSQDLVNLAFGIAQRENPAHAGELDGAIGTGAISNRASERAKVRMSQLEADIGQKALAEFAKNDELFEQPKSTKDTIEGIAHDHDTGIKVRKTDFPGGETMYTLTLPKDQGTARITVRRSTKHSPYDAGLDEDGNARFIPGRPGENPEDVPAGTEDVWIDVSQLKTGQGGAMAYNIAATFAHNTGRIFIGDPNGLSTVALRRRLENMISSALKFGTTRHLAPHPDQVRGGHGVPPLRWVYGDDVGNVERMIEASVQALDNAFPGSKLLAYDPDIGYYPTNAPESAMDRRQLVQVLGKRLREYRVAAGAGATGQAGWRTVSRAALFRYFRQASSHEVAEDRGRGRVLAALGTQLARLHSDGTTGALGSDAERKSRIFYSRTASLTSPNSLRAKTQQAVTDLFNHPGKVGWWHKTVGTMHNLAQRSPQFKRVFDSVNQFVNDVSAYATEAADMAPNILPKLETWRDVLRSPISADDSKAIASPIFEGTLSWARDPDGRLMRSSDLQRRYANMDTERKKQMLLERRRISEAQIKSWQNLPNEAYEGAIRNRFESEFLQDGVVFTDAELRQHFGLTPGQIKLYREFRAAADKSLTILAKTEMLRYGGEDVAPMREVVMDAETVEDAAQLLSDTLMQMADDQPKRRTVLLDAAGKMAEKAGKVRELMDRGYAPLSRFGQYTLDVVDASGERVYFGMFDTQFAANRMKRKMRENYPGATLRSGTVSEEAYKMFSGISPETLEIFGEMVGLEGSGDRAQDKMFQQYLKLAKANRSAMKRLVHRKGIAGFSEDAGRVLAGFVYSNARLASTNMHTNTINHAVAAIDPTKDGQGQLRDMAQKLADYVRNPQEEAQKIRGMLFAQYLGGSLASAFVNLTQPVAVTMPYLSQFGGVRQAVAQTKSALADVFKPSTGDKALDAALKKAEEEGIVAPQEVHHLMAQAQGRGSLQSGDGTLAGNAAAGVSNAWQKTMLAWGKPFAAAEQFNRRVTFIAAWRIAVKQGMADPAKFAADAITETQFLYTKANRPQWARGAIGATLFTFKSYSISYIELMHRLAFSGTPEGRKAAVFMLAMLFLMGGAGGLPFMEDAEDVIDAAAQRMGYSFSYKNTRKRWLEDFFGRTAAEFIDSGVSGLPGVPLDVSGRLGLGNLVPGTGLLVKRQTHDNDLREIAGPAGDFAKRVFTGADKVTGGEVLGGAMEAMPTAVRNVAKAVDMYATGMYRDTKGRKVVDVDGYDTLIKAAGFQPREVHEVQEGVGTQQYLVGQNRIQRDVFSAAMKEAVFKRDHAEQERIRQKVRAWNERNPDSPIKIDMAAVRRGVVEMRRSKQERVERAAPKTIRANVRQALRQEQGERV